MTDRHPVQWIADTNVLSRPPRQDESNPPVARWIRQNAHLIRVSAVTIAEARRGLVLEERRIERLRDDRAARRDRAILVAKVAWYEQLKRRFADRIIAIDATVAERWADVSVLFPSIRDGDKAILATALVHGYGIATRNLRDFKSSGIPLVDPFDPATWWDGDVGLAVPDPEG